MQTIINGTRPITIVAHDPACDLDAWDDAITALNNALSDAAAARLALDHLHRRLEAVEASVALSVEGRNSEERKARLMLALADDHLHEETVSNIDQERTRLLDAERRVMVAKERCRLLRTALLLYPRSV